ncbi:MAG TPA: acyl-CoA dehydrogenase family protein, partial [Acidimicrobiales bacterium]|nr:acyl-CoA dehydrogenase family protein [Acidimicrobiales bacterium]
ALAYQADFDNARRWLTFDLLLGRVATVVDTADLEVRTVGGLDPRLGIAEVAGSDVPATARTDPPPAAWSHAVAAGQRAVGHELVGASRTMLGLAREHALERVQFGRPIAMFQAVRHRLAEAYVAVEAADAALAAAWDDGTPLTAAMAKAVAGRCARTVSRHCQQVLAGIGFTTEHDLHLYVRRVIVLDRLLGDSRSLTRRLGEDLLARRSLPSILPL